MNFFKKLAEALRNLLTPKKKDPWENTYPKDVAKPKNPLPLDPDSGMT